jgi:hypothetical protein
MFWGSEPILRIVFFFFFSPVCVGSVCVCVLDLSLFLVIVVVSTGLCCEQGSSVVL